MWKILDASSFERVSFTESTSDIFTLLPVAVLMRICLCRTALNNYFPMLLSMHLPDGLRVLLAARLSLGAPQCRQVFHICNQHLRARRHIAKPADTKDWPCFRNSQM